MPASTGRRRSGCSASAPRPCGRGAANERGASKRAYLVLRAASEARSCVMRVAILGVGLIGGSIGLAARGRDGGEVVGFDPDPATLARAVSSGAVDRGAET